MAFKKDAKYRDGGLTASTSLFKQFRDYRYSGESIYDLDEFHKVFIEMEDPTEYTPALKLVGSWQKWLQLKNDVPKFNNIVELWKDELETKLRSRAAKKLKTLMERDGKEAAMCARWFAEEGFNRRSGAGRPNYLERNRKAKELARLAAETEEERSRVLSLLGIKGGESNGKDAEVQGQGEEGEVING